MGMSYEGNHRFVSNKEQPQCRDCGSYAQIVSLGDAMDRIYCSKCDKHHALWRQNERLQDQRSKL